MSNILIIKHGSLGDIVQISGVLRDLRENHNDKKILILTTLPYVELLSKCPYVDGVLIDKRLPRWNLIYLLKLKKLVDKFNFSHIYDLQNSSRTSFYRKFLIKSSIWSSTETILKKNEIKKNFDHEPVLERFKTQLEKSNVNAKYTTNPDFSWAQINIDNIINRFFRKKFILLFPFCSPNLPHKKWPYFAELVKIIKSKNLNFEVAIAPGPNEFDEAKKIGAISIQKDNKPLNIMELAGLIKKASFVISNDTGPAHMTAHLNKEGVVIFGHHTTPKKVSIETDKFKAILVENLKDLNASQLYSEIESKLTSIN